MNQDIDHSFMAKVTSVNGMLCNVTDDGYEYYDVRLRASDNGNSNKTMAVPTVGSWVVVSRIKNSDELFVSMISEVDEIFLRGGDFGGLVKIEELVNRLNAIEKAFNNLLNEYKLHVHTDPVSGTTTSMTPPSTQGLISETQRSDLENKNVNHG